MSNRTAVVILNWNTRNFLELFLPNVIKYSSTDAEIIVVDNASTDDSINFVENNYPSVKIIRNTENSGFAGGYNTALLQIDYEYFVLLNSDVDVTEGWLLPLIKLMDNNSEVGACQPKILSFHSKDYFEYAGSAGGYIDKYGYPFCRGRIFNTLEKDNHQYDDSRPVFWATGACMIVRASVFKKLHGFDPVFFAHMEEIDLCWRMQRAGFHVFFCGLSKVYHLGGGTLPKSNPRKTFLNFRNNLLMIYKNAESSEIKSILSVRFILDVIASIKFLFSGSLADFKAVWAARRAFNILKSQYQRPFSPTKPLSPKTGFFIYPKSILWDYYICRRKKFSSLPWKEASNVPFEATVRKQ